MLRLLLLLHFWRRPRQVAGAIKGLSVEQVLAYEASGAVSVAGYELGPGDIKVGADS